MTKSKLTDEERKHYREVIALIIEGDAEQKKRVDNAARLQLASLRSAMPNADTETLVVFMLSMAAFMAKLMTTPLMALAESVEQVFDNNVVAVAHAVGAYDVDDPSDLPVFDPATASRSAQAAFAEGLIPRKRQPDTEKELDDILGRQYL